ncbi:lipoate--protein ligase [Carnobacterium viridans]|uniref:lipoate--protein ligase n=1 Tax=Carnobacterium viridans TaxID=174587 RepID=A0A1H1BFM9_9LACT|nr:lipoate--protein ligase [Carnobacterium viridans]UDE95804.1 lipoate--protein ligase [Carnobacterium viridans]SDQ50765.1 lipoate-protein ligase [Carnobacterium viridans]
MYYVKNVRNGKEITDPAINLAIEYHLLNNVVLDEPILLFYINEPSIIIGRNQNTIEEINTDYVEKKNIHVVRRFSGGGAVYHDFGVFCFCFITKDDGNSFRDFGKFTEPIIDSLHKMGVEGAKLEGRNDLLINGQKFSGNAMYSKNGRMTAHGTIMFDSDIEEVVNALKVRKDKIESKGIKSIRSRVTNIKPYLSDDYQFLSTKEFRDRLILKIFDVQTPDGIKEYELTEKDWKKIEELSRNYFNNWDWNYGKSPKFELVRRQRFSIGSVEFKMNVDKGLIQDIRIFGDFFGLGDISDVEERLNGIKYDVTSISEALDDINIKNYFGNITKEELIHLIY